MNVQQTIISGIKEQLYQHSFLVLPNFGGFVLKHSPAHFTSAGGMLAPASKTVSFNLQLKQNDGVLALWLQNKINCTSIEALNHLTEFADYCSGILQTKRRLSFDSIGFFYLDFENNICFEPQKDANFLTDSFGLGPISISELEAEAKESKRETVYVDRVVVQETSAIPTPVKRRSYRFVTPLLLGLVLLSSLVLLVSNTKITGNLKSALFGTETKSVYSPLSYQRLDLKTYAVDNKDYVVDANGIANLTLDEDKRVAVKVSESNSSGAPTSLVSSKRSANYEIVLGCFTVLSNAKRMADKLSSQNINAIVSQKNERGMHVVSMGNFDTKEQATQKLQEMKDAFPKAWIKKP